MKTSDDDCYFRIKLLNNCLSWKTPNTHTKHKHWLHFWKCGPVIYCECIHHHSLSRFELHLTLRQILLPSSVLFHVFSVGTVVAPSLNWPPRYGSHNIVYVKESWLGQVLLHCTLNLVNISHCWFQVNYNLVYIDSTRLCRAQ